MKFDEMWKVYNRITKDHNNFYKNYWKEISVVNIGAMSVLVGGLYIVGKIKVRSYSKNDKNNIKEEES